MESAGLHIRIPGIIFNAKSEPMKKQFTLSFIAVLFAFNSFSQDVGYRTVDVGAGYQYIENGMLTDLLVSINAEEHHSFIVRAGYITTNGLRTHLHKNEEGNGWGGGLGYRYHFSVIPKRFFIGAKVNLWNMKIHWNMLDREEETKLLVIQPAIETGYTLLINDIFFITPNFSATYQKTIKTTGEKVAYGNGGFVPMAGITMGWRF
jgi:hypothetical protein